MIICFLKQSYFKWKKKTDNKSLNQQYHAVNYLQNHIHLQHPGIYHLIATRLLCDLRVNGK